MARSVTNLASAVRFTAVVCALVGAGCDSAVDPLLASKATVSKVCLDCHNDAERVGELTLEQQDFRAIAGHAPLWEKVVRKLRAGMMPPADGPRLDPNSRTALATWLEAELDRAAASTPNPGRTPAFHRLNRSEYRNAVHDLLDVDLDVSELLPGDDSSYGFDNMAGVLKISPLLLERYLAAAEKISRVAIGRPSGQEGIDYFRVPDDLSQEDRLPGFPFGTRGGTSLTYAAPVDAEYVIAVELARDMNEQVPPYAERQHLEISVDGQRVTLFTLESVKESPPEPERDLTSQIVQIRSRFRLSPAERESRNRADKDWRVRVPLSAGSHSITATFLAMNSALDETTRLPFQRPFPGYINIPETRRGAYLRAVEIAGPYNPTGPGRASSRTRVRVCEPDVDDHSAEGSIPCASKIMSTLARRAYRRPVSDTDVEPLMGFFRAGYADGGFDAGVRLALKRLLVSPEFLFRVEADPEKAKPDAPYRISDLALASRLSFFLWSSIPDDELLDLAATGRLRERAELEHQVRRMIADPRSQRFVENFAGQWLYLRNLQAAVPTQTKFPDFDDTLRQGLRQETELFFSSIVREDRSALDLLRADYTYLNERVARHYGIQGIKGSHFRRVSYGLDNPRRGLLGHGSILTVTSRPDRTSPVVRGKWVLENLLGSPPPAPPPNVPGLVETNGAGVALSMRERLAAHRANPVCASCHSLMDPIGFSLENYDAVGQWRTLGDADEIIDASGSLPGGPTFKGAGELRAALLSSDRFVMTMTEKLLAYALGRGVEYFDLPTVRAIVRDAAKSDYRFSSFLTGVIESPAFTLRTPGVTTPTMSDAKIAEAAE